MIEYTNLNPLPELGGDHILYVPQYLSADDPRYAQTDEEVLRAYTDALALINPAFDRAGSSSPRSSATASRSRSASPTTGPRPRRIQTPVPNLFLTDSCQLHPHDRTISGSFGLGLEAARRALATGMSALLVVAGAALLWPVLAGAARPRHRAGHARSAAASSAPWPSASRAVAPGGGAAASRRARRWYVLEEPARHAVTAPRLTLATPRACGSPLSGSRRPGPGRERTPASRHVLDGLVLVAGAAFSSGRPCSWLGFLGWLREVRPACDAAPWGRRSSWPRRSPPSPRDFGPYRGARLRARTPAARASAWPAPSTAIRDSRAAGPSFRSRRGSRPSCSGTSCSWSSTATGGSRATTPSRSRGWRRTPRRRFRAAVGSPIAWPANWIFAARHDVSAGAVRRAGRGRPLRVPSGA